MWSTIGRYALKLALWCFKNRADIHAAYDTVHIAVEDIRDVRDAHAALKEK